MALNLPGIPVGLHYTPEETGVPSYADALMKGLNVASKGVESIYKPRTMAEQLLAQQLANRINKPKADRANEWFEAQLKNMGAQTGLYGAQAGKYTEDTSKSIQDRLETKRVMDFLNKNKNGGVSPPSQGASLGVDNQGNVVYGNYEKPGDIQEEEEEEEVGEKPVSEYPTNYIPPEIRYLAQKHKIPLPGESKQELNRTKEFDKVDAAVYKEYIESHKGMQNQATALDELTQAISANKEFPNVTGPIGTFLTKWAGTPQQRELLGRLQTGSGEIALQVAPSLKGAFTGRDQALINQIKANPSDFPAIFIGKLKAQKLINSVLMKRSELAANSIRNGMDPIRAAKLAAQKTPLERYKKDIDKMLNGNKAEASLSQKITNGMQSKMVKITNSNTGETRTVSIEEARRLGVPNV